MLRSRRLLQNAAPLAMICLLAACSDNGREPLLSQVQPTEIPAADTTTRVNININNPTLAVPATFPVGDGDLLTLVWSDEFNGAQLDPDTWFFETGDGSQYGIPRWGNNELQYYLPDNARLENGRLIIEAKRETVGNFGYTSARITTQDRIAVQYGRIEARMKLPAGQGLWPAFWMLPQAPTQNAPPAEGVYGGFSASGEIDIMEAVNLGGRPGPAGFGGGNTIFGTIHFGGEFPANQFTTVEYEVAESLTDGFNTFAVEWDESEIRWYVNGILFAVQNSWFSSAAPYPAPFDQPFEILLNLAVGGNFPGGPDGSTPFPATMEVDYVRVYSGENPNAAPGNEPTTPAPTPTEDPAGVISVFSDAYTDIGADFNPNFGQATIYSPASIAGNEMLKYAGLDFQIIDFSSNPQDVSGQGYLHVDVWTADSTALNVSLVSPGPVETPYAIPVTANSWTSVDIPLTDFAGVDLGNVIQIKFDGNGTIFVDNIYFAGDAPPPATQTPAPDDVIYSSDPNEMVDLMTTITAFGTSSVFDGAYSLDPDYSPAFLAQSGSGYGLDNILQLGFVGLPAGFASGYESFGFKIKSDDLPGNSIEIKLEQGGSCGVISLADTNFSTPLGNGWFEVEVPLSNCTGVGTAVGILFERVGPQNADGGTPFSVLLTDIGFNNPGALAGIIPDDVIYATDPNETVDLVPTITAFGTTSQFDGAYALDPDFNPAFEAQSGSGYGLDHIVQLGFVGLPAGFASGYESFVFKIKSADLPGNSIEVKMEGGGTCGLIDLANTALSTPLGNGWFQVVLPMSNCAGVNTAVGILFERVGAQTADGGTAFSFLATDIGFNNPVGGGGELLTNGDFEAGQSPWIGQATVVDDGGNNVLQGVVTNPDPGQPFLVNGSQVVELTQGETYTLTFRARATQARSLLAGIGLNVAPFTAVVENVPLTTAWQAYTFTLTATGFGGPDSRVLFDMNGEAGDVFIDDVSLTVGSLLTNGDFEAGQSPWIGQATVVDDAGNNVLQGVVTNPDPGQPFLVNGSQVLDITQDQLYVLTFKARATQARSMIAGIGLNVAPFTAVTESVPLTTTWQTFTYSLTATGFGGPDSRVLFDMNGEAGDVFIDDVALAVIPPANTGGGGGGGGGTQLAVNGDFETGDFTGWQQAVNSGAQSISSDTPTNGGSFSAALSANTAPGNGGTTEIKQANLGAGTLNVGDVVTITFDVKGTFGPGGQLNVLSFTEFGGGGADLSNQTIIAGGVDNWTTQSYDVTLSGSDAGGGFSLAFNPVCGAVAGCVADVLIDNVSIVVN